MAPTRMPEAVIGLDVGKSSHWACVATRDGEVLLSAPVANREGDLDSLFGRFPDALVVVDQSRNRQSGTSISSVTASRQGNKRLKNLLIFSCNCLTRTEGRWGDYYTRCRERGMSHGKALKALARKRLKVIYAVMRDRVPYAA